MYDTEHIRNNYEHLHKGNIGKHVGCEIGRNVGTCKMYGKYTKTEVKRSKYTKIEESTINLLSQEHLPRT